MPKRLKFDVSLEPVAGQRFQPTGFPDLGTGRFSKPGPDNTWIESILVESEQSMANHLEGTAWEFGLNEPHLAFSGLPYTRVVNPAGEYLTSSRTEAHRLSSAFIREGKHSDGTDMVDFFKKTLDLREDRPMSARTIAGAILALDPLCLVHGVFFADPKLPGQPKITRALTSFVEADDVRAAESGGVKRDSVLSKNTDSAGSAEGYGSIPFHRTLWTARDITATFVLDLDQLGSYGLSSNATRLLEVIALWEIRSLIDRGLRLRTMCDLQAKSDPNGLPSAVDLTSELRSLIDSLGDEVGNGVTTTVVWSTGSGKKKLKPGAKTDESAETGDDPQ
jgi:CRISPR-associated protein Csb1